MTPQHQSGPGSLCRHAGNPATSGGAEGRRRRGHAGEREAVSALHRLVVAGGAAARRRGDHRPRAAHGAERRVAHQGVGAVARRRAAAEDARLAVGLLHHVGAATLRMVNTPNDQDDQQMSALSIAVTCWLQDGLMQRALQAQTVLATAVTE